MAPSADAFYLASPPTFLQQGDIAADVPLVLLPPLERLVLIRSAHHKLPIDHLQPGNVVLVDEIGVTDAFDRGTEYAAVSVQRGYAMLMTPTCDLPNNSVWSVWPLRPLQDSGLQEGNLNAGKYANLYRLPDHEYFDSAFLDVSDVRPISPEQFTLKNRVASITREGQDAVLQKFHRALGRMWGYAEGETIEALGKYETGRFRCAHCNLYDVDVPLVELKPGMKAPPCPNCKKIGRSGQWYPITKHRKS